MVGAMVNVRFRTASWEKAGTQTGLVGHVEERSIEV